MKLSNFAIVLVLCSCFVACSRPADPAPTDDAGDAATVDGGRLPDGATDASADDGGSDAGPDAADLEACDRALREAAPVPAPDRIHTPRWAFLPWISKDISDAADTYAFVDGFIERDIPVGTVVLDSPWETNYNTLVPNPERYPDFDVMVGDMRDRGVRVVLWTTQMVNKFSFDAENGGDSYPSPSPNFPMAERCGYFVEDGRQYTWWKGRGGAIDFFNPEAAAWWHEQQDPLLELGVAGWKLDFGDEYITHDPIETAAGTVSKQEYSEAYYKDFYEYGIAKSGHEDFVTMVRAYDASYQFPGRFFARPEHAPIVWVGDNRRDWVGLSDAMDHTFRSAAAGYVVVGSDLGGYLDRDDQDLDIKIPFDRANFLRWLAMSALTPFMQLHGRANMTPWSLPDDSDPDESVALYRYWSYLHTELIPFFYSLAEEAYAGRAAPIIRPIGEEQTWAGDYRYMLGDALLVAPILDETGSREVMLPAGEWFDWWTGQPISGPASVVRDYSTDLGKIPLFVKNGAIIPLESSSSVTGVTEGDFADALTLLAWPSAQVSTFALHPEQGARIDVELHQDGQTARLRAPRAPQRVIVRMRTNGAVVLATLNGNPLMAAASQAELAGSDGYLVDGDYVWLSAGASDQPLTLEVQTSP